MNKHAPLYVELHNKDHHLLKELPGKITVMNSTDIFHKAIQHHHIDVQQYLESQE